MQEVIPTDLYIAHISIHGLIRGQQQELGLDADTGGQVKYVVDLVKALSLQPGVERVDLYTRQIIDESIDSQYAEPLEPLTEKAQIVRLPAGPEHGRVPDCIGLFGEEVLPQFRE